MICIKNVYLNGGLLGKGDRWNLCDTSDPTFSWAVVSGTSDDRQIACRVTLEGSDGKLLWDSGWVEQSTQSLVCAGAVLPVGEKLGCRVFVRNTAGETAQSDRAEFVMGLREEWPGEWIVPTQDEKRRVIYYRKEFTLPEGAETACLYTAGIGYQRVWLNGCRLDASVMDPAWSNYAKTVYYAVLPSAGELLKKGTNVLAVEVADGWRRNESEFVKKATGGREIEFEGRPMLRAVLDIRTSAGTLTVPTDESWEWKYGPVVEANVFDGETYDASQADLLWNTAEGLGFAAVATNAGPGGRLLPMALEPITEHETYPAVDVFEPKKGVFVLDFGQNIAGVLKMHLPATLQKGQKITVSFMEFLDEDGTLYMAPLRGAKQTDTYIAAGDERDLTVWQPQFTYHGFRYAQVTGLAQVGRDTAEAVALYTDAAADSRFSCGDALVTKIHQNCVQTEKANIHSLLTDCPQRDERMGWMNDATVRFEETPYNFRIGRLFPKVVRDIRNEQRDTGAFTCCAPYIFGALPADPVCSSYLVAAWETVLHTGDLTVLRDGFDGFERWEQFLLSQSDDYIVNYSYYGDWAGPAYACVSMEFAVSRETPGILMSTGYSYYNCRLLAKFASLLGNAEKEAEYIGLAEKVRAAFLKKWWDAGTGKVAAGSEGSQAFALWLGLLPEEGRQAAADVLHQDLVARDYKFTTGNLCTRYMLDVLTRWGYVEDAWKILNSTSYPSYGYMIENEATTVWERFELKKNPEMNSHNHPMYASIDYWFYAYLCGIQPTEPGYEKVSIHPYYPADLLSAHAVVDTVKGDISVRWVRRYGSMHLYVTVPFGVSACVTLPKGTQTVGSGSHHFSWVLEE